MLKDFGWSEIFIIVLAVIIIGVAIIFLKKGKKASNDEKRSKFDQIAFEATIFALFISPLIGTAGNVAISNWIGENGKKVVETLADKLTFDPYDEDKIMNSVPDENEVQISTDDEQVQEGEKLTQDELEKLVAENPNIIFKDDIFLVEVRVRNVTADQDKPSEEKEYLKSVDAAIGDEIEYQIHYKNTSADHADDVMVAVSLPTNCEYVEGSTIVYNSHNPKGVKNTNDTIHTTGINIGGYNEQGDAYIRFRTVIDDKNLVSGTNRLVEWSKITNWVYKYDADGNVTSCKGEALLDNADVYVHVNDLLP